MVANVDAVTGPAHVTHSLCNRFQPKRKRSTEYAILQFLTFFLIIIAQGHSGNEVVHYSQTSIIRIVGTELNGPDSRKCLLGMLCNAQGSQSEPSEFICISYGACEHQTGTDLCYEVKQTQFPPEFHHLIFNEKKKFCCAFKI